MAGCLLFSSFARAQVTPAAQTATPPSSKTIHAPAEVLNKMLPLITDFGSNGELTDDVLGLGTKNQPWSFREIAAAGNPFDDSAPMHTFAISRGTSPDDVLVSIRLNGKMDFLRAHRNGQVVKAFSIETSNHTATPISTSQAQKELNAEFDFWDTNIDRMTHWYACMAQMAGPDSVTPQRKMDACTWLIQSGKETPFAVSMAYVNRSISYQRKNRKQELADLHQATKVAPTNSDAWAYLCQTENWTLKHRKDALQACQKAVELNPKSPEAWTYRGDIDLRLKKYDLAIANYDQAIALNPNWMWPLDNRGEAYLREGRFDRALLNFNEVIRVSPDYAVGYLDRGILEMKENKLDAALADFQAGSKVQPEYGGCLFGQGLVKYAKGDKAGGKADMAKARKLTPKAATNFKEDGIPIP
jgi:tetratricopeptide (TPR) repeat protein